MSYLTDRQYGFVSHRNLLVKLKNSSSITRRLKLCRTLDVHHGCVNTIAWNDNGTTILSGSDDQHLIITDPYTSQKLADVHSGHRENIFSAKFLPETDDRQVVSCSGDGMLFHTNFDRPPQTHSHHGCFTCHGASTAYEVRVFPRTPNLFLSCSDDCTVRLFDLRTKSHCLKSDCTDDVLIRSKWCVTSMDINPMNPHEIVCACSDSSVRLYDHRKLSTQLPSSSSSTYRTEASINGLISRFVLVDRKERRPPRITSVVFNRYGTEILTSYSSESLYLLDPKQNISHEQSQIELTNHREEKKSRLNRNEPKSVVNDTSDTSASTDKEKKSSQFKRLRLRGDWSDTGPDSRPSNEETSTSPAPAPAEPSTDEPSSSGDTPNRNLQNFFMQRMSDLLTQLVTRSATDENETQATTTTTTDPATEATATEVSSTSPPPEPEPEPETATPVVQLPPSPTPMDHPDNDRPEPGPNTTETTEDTQTTTETNRRRTGFFDVLFGGNRRGANPGGDDDDDDGDDDDDDDEAGSVGSIDEDEENNESNEGTASNSNNSGRARRPLMSSKWDRIMKRREAERRHEENLLKTVPSLGIINSFDGHRNARTMIKEANFWSDSYVMSGSDCGHIFIWNKFTGQIIRIINADKHVVNCLQPHPLNHPILASSGIDYDIKLFSPLAEKPIDDSARIGSTVKRNHAMLEETSSTITVPASFMFRMLTSFYRLRRPEGLFGLDDRDDDESTQ